MRDKCGRQGRDKCKLMQPKEPRVGDKGETSVYKLMRPKAPRVRDKCGRQGGDTRKTSVNSCGPRHPEWDARQETPNSAEQHCKEHGKEVDAASS